MIKKLRLWAAVFGDGGWWGKAKNQNIWAVHKYVWRLDDDRKIIIKYLLVDTYNII